MQPVQLFIRLLGCSLAELSNLPAINDEKDSWIHGKMIVGMKPAHRRKTVDDSESQIYDRIQSDGVMAGVIAVAVAVAVSAACGVKNTCAAKHAVVRVARNSKPMEKASISQLIDRSASDKILSSFWFCPTHRSTFDGPHASCRLSPILS
jgi:hypothetical protein